MIKKIFFTGFVFVLLGFLATSTDASHSWGTYHWARSANPLSLSLSLGDNVSSSWDAYLTKASSDWNASTVLNTSVEAGLGGKNCKANNGRVEVCNSKYGNNGWLGLAQIWISGEHITKGVVKMNDTYFNTAKYNTLAWKQMVVCQEIGHTFGLDHQDEIFGNPNLGTCMDYTNDPSTNQGPNAHDFAQLVEIYSHLDSANTQPPKKNRGRGNAEVNLDNPSEWGQSIRESSDKKTSVFERDLGQGNKVFTFVTWAD